MSFERDGAPAWADGGVIVPWVIYQRYGDVRILERHWDAMERYLAYLRPPQPGPAVEGAPQQRLRRLAVGRTPRRRARCSPPPTWRTTPCSWRGWRACWARPDRAAHYDALHRDVAAAFNRAYVGEDALIEGDTQTVYLLALHMELLPQELRARAAERLVADIERHDWHLTTGFVGVALLCPVLTEHGYADVAHRLLLNETFPSWGYSIRHGATTIWERWDGWTEEHGFQTPMMNSFNHYSLGSVAQWLYEYVAGIRLDPERPGLRARDASPRRPDSSSTPRPRSSRCAARSAAPGGERPSASS